MVDICNPPLIWLDGRCYRVNSEVNYHVDSGYTGETEESMDLCDTVATDAENSFLYQIEELGNNSFKVTMPVASSFFPLIIGSKGNTKDRIQNETKTRISIPRKGMEGDIIINGSDRKGVMSAANRIDVMVEAARSKQPFTHFISIPVNVDHVQQAFKAFKKEVLESCNSVRGLDETIFQTPSLLHLTVGTMALMDDREREIAREILTDCKEDLIIPLTKGKCLKFEVSGLEYMNDDPAEVDVLYCGVKDPSGVLQQIVDGIVEKFVNSGLMKKEYEKVKLHLTLLNTIFRKDQGDLSESFAGQARESFDCRPLLEGWGDIFLGEVDLDEIHLSQRRAGRRTNEGYYLPSSIVNINKCG